MSALTATGRPAPRPRRRGFTLVEMVVVVVVLGVLAAVAAVAYSQHLSSARRAAALEQMRQVALSAATLEAKNDVDAHTALEQAATECNCFVSVDPSSNALYYRKDSTSVYATAAGGKVSAATAPAGYSTYAATVLSAHPLGYWRLDELAATIPALDSAGPFAGTYAGSGVTFGASPAANLDGKSVTVAGTQGVTLPADARLGLNTRSFSVAAWVYPTAVPTTWAQWFGGGPNSIAVGLTNGRFTATQSNVVDAPFGPVIAPNKWTFTVVTYDAATHAISYYVNGALAASSTWTSQDPARTGQSTTLGYTNAYGAPFRGSLDEIALWDRVITGAQVSQMYRAGTGS